MAKRNVSVLALSLIIMSLIGNCYGQLKVGFYNGKCKRSDVEQVIFTVVRVRFQRDPSLVAALLRMQFHDCFVHGCDASILLDGQGSEKDVGANGSVRGYEVIDAAKAAVEKICPGVVSCADIIVIATRASVFLARGKWYNVETGRRDGLVSRASDVDLPGPTISVPAAIQAFARKGLNTQDMVLLFGGHTIGVTHCFFIMDRLYNFQNTGRPDRTMDPTLLNALGKTCPRNSPGTRAIALDQNPRSLNVVDNSYYKQLLAGRGVLQIDQAVALDPRTSAIVKNLASASDFATRFGQAMVKLGAVQVLTGQQGEIRRSCRATN